MNLRLILNHLLNDYKKILLILSKEFETKDVLTNKELAQIYISNKENLNMDYQKFISNITTIIHLTDSLKSEGNGKNYKLKINPKKFKRYQNLIRMIKKEAEENN